MKSRFKCGGTLFLIVSNFYIFSLAEIHPHWIEIDSTTATTTPFALRNRPHNNPDKTGTAFQFVSSGGNTIARIEFLNPVDIKDRSIVFTQTDPLQPDSLAILFSGQQEYKGSVAGLSNCIWTVQITGEWDAFTIRCGGTTVVNDKKADALKSDFWFDPNIGKTNQLKFVNGITKYRYAECEMLELNWIQASVETVDPLPQLITSEVALKCKAGDEVPYKLSGDKVVTCSLLTSVWMFEENLGQPTCTSTGGKKMDFS
ncbi:hypothetical protein ACHWQZ_G007653 [Mnemiopsis leidyi]